MKKFWLLIAAGLLSCTGCTTVWLEEYTIRQTESSGGGRDRLVMNSLAAVAADPNTLPPYALYSNGIATVTDSATIALNDRVGPDEVPPAKYWPDRLLRPEGPMDGRSIGRIPAAPSNSRCLPVGDFWS